MRRNGFSVISISLALILALLGCSRQQEMPGAASPTTDNEVAAASRVLATIADDEKLAAVPVEHGASFSPQNKQAPSFQVVFSESGRGAAYVVQKSGKVCVVHNQNRGKEYSDIGTIVLSPDGKSIAYCALVDGKWSMVVSGKEGRPYDTLLTPIFSPDGRHVVYQAKEGAKWYVIVDNTRNEGTIASYTTPEFSSDSSKIVYVEAAASNADMKLIVSDLTFRKQHVKRSIGDQLFAVNRDKTRIAAEQVVNNQFRIIDFSFDKPEDVHEGKLYDLIDKMTFSSDGTSLCYCTIKDKKRLLVLDNREETLPNGGVPQLPVVRPDSKVVGIIFVLKNKYFLHQSFLGRASRNPKYDEAADLAYSKDSRFYAYAARRGDKWFIVVNGNEGPAFDRVISPVFSPDGEQLVYRARKDGKRFLVVSDTAGKTREQHPAYEMVFQPVFSADGKSVVYGVKDGNRLICKIEKL